MMLHDDMHARATKAATAIQFHDRLAQCLMHVSASLSMMAQFVANGDAKSGTDWDALCERVRGLMSMERERALFDAMSGTPGSPSVKNERDEAESGKVELF
jgi:hypothetical protein